ncbi:hypothetical protein [Stutzerimonas kirkiae]|uniref:hypothetical protein n=1 Tax=Stutzerimonas kirkiae TaxID=2211392 RepID=UPI0010384E2D|nr:hypothetical protein [Stutzerimonas kirkiae]
MSKSLKELSNQEQAVLLRAAEVFSEEQIRLEIERAITWGPALQIAALTYAIKRRDIPEVAWNALAEMKSWGAALHSIDESGEEILLTDQSIFELIIEAIRLLLEGVASILSEKALVPECSASTEVTLSPSIRRGHKRLDDKSSYDFG